MMARVGKVSRADSQHAQDARRAELDQLRRQRALSAAEQQEYDRLHNRLYFRVYRRQGKKPAAPACARTPAR